MAQAQGALDHPAKKMFLQMLGQEDVLATLEPEDHIWVEGRIKQVDEAARTFLLDDANHGSYRGATATVDFSSIRRLPADVIAVDCCVMVIGRVEARAPDALIKAIRISPIADSEVDTVFWEMEVVQQHREVFRRRREERYRLQGDPMAGIPMGY